MTTILNLMGRADWTTPVLVPAALMLMLVLALLAAWVLEVRAAPVQVPAVVQGLLVPVQVPATLTQVHQVLAVLVLWRCGWRG